MAILIFYYVENNEAVYKATVNDFVEASDYSLKMEEWKKRSYMVQ